jgi:hypothetical protein
MDRIDALNADLDEAVRNGEINEQEADIEYKATLARWKREDELMASIA